MHHKLTIAPLALALSIAFAAAAPQLAHADGFGYHDPRSVQIRTDSVDTTPDGGFVYISDGKVWKYSPTDGLSVVAGGGRKAPGMKPIPATSAYLSSPARLAAADDGSLLLTEIFSHVVYRVSPDGLIAIAAGNGSEGSSGDGGPATSAQLMEPIGVAPTIGGGFLITDLFASNVREVLPDGTITTVAGTGHFGFNGDGGPATDAQLNAPYSVARTADGGTLIGDLGNARVRKVMPNGNITTVAGTGVAGYNGDGIPATSAQLSGASPPVILNGPTDVESLPDGGFLIADSGNRRIREVSPDGTITTIAGNGKKGYNGDGIQATDATVLGREVALTDDGGFLVLDAGRIRKVSADGVISTVAGMPSARGCSSAPYNGIQGTQGSDSLAGAELRDLIRGEAAADSMAGGADSDCEIGGSGPDELAGDAGADTLVGGSGTDQLDGDDGSDRLTGGGDDDELAGGDGADHLNGGKGRDTISGGNGKDVINSSADGGPDRVKCGAGHDRVRADRIDRVAPNCEVVIVDRH